MSELFPLLQDYTKKTLNKKKKSGIMFWGIRALDLL